MTCVAACVQNSPRSMFRQCFLDKGFFREKLLGRVVVGLHIVRPCGPHPLLRLKALKAAAETPEQRSENELCLLLVGQGFPAIDAGIVLIVSGSQPGRNGYKAQKGRADLLGWLQPAI